MLLFNLITTCSASHITNYMKSSKISKQNERLMLAAHLQQEYITFY